MVCLQLYGNDIKPRHCLIAHTAGVVTVTPAGKDALTYVDGQLIHDTTMLQHGMTVKFGNKHLYRFIDPNHHIIDEVRSIPYLYHL